jgi:hypothetical protein
MHTHEEKINPGNQIVRFADEESGDRCVSGTEYDILPTSPKWSY